MDKQSLAGDTGKPILYAIIGGLVGATVALLVSNYSVNNRNYQMMRMMGMGAGAQQMMKANGISMMGMDGMMGHEEGMTMDEMVSSLITLRGDVFDRAFIEAMIEHHQGAIDMANLIPSRSERPELRKLGEDIMVAQSGEIEMMQSWLRDWFSE